MLQRTLVGIILAILFLAMLYFGDLFQDVIIALATFISVYEMKSVFAAKKRKIFAIPAYIFAVFYCAAYKHFKVAGLVTLMLSCVIATMLESLFNPKRDEADCYYALSMFSYPILFYIMLMLVANISTFEISRVALLMTMAGPLIGDTAAYFVGVLTGKHKLFLNISPNKTLEGSIGGLLGGTAGGVVVYFAQRLWGVDLPLWHLILLGLACGVIGQFGDLYASRVKRWAGVKDYGKLFPGHGGMMDRVDSALICAPVLVYFVGMFGI